jgi:hypothetical protein
MYICGIEKFSLNVDEATRVFVWGHIRVCMCDVHVRVSHYTCVFVTVPAARAPLFQLCSVARPLALCPLPSLTTRHSPFPLQQVLCKFECLIAFLPTPPIRPCLVAVPYVSQYALHFSSSCPMLSCRRADTRHMREREEDPVAT